MYKGDNNVEINNVARVSGVISEKFEFDHEMMGEAFYRTFIECIRNSGTVDYIPVVVSERLLDVTKDCTGQYVYVNGHYRSYNKHDGTKTHLLLNVFVREIEITEVPENRQDINEIKLTGFVCKTPNYRRTPLGRHITDVMLAVNRRYGKSDYIPCVCWGRDAMYAAGLKVGSEIYLYGRIQCRHYDKKISETEIEDRIAYEVTVSNYEMVA